MFSVWLDGKLVYSSAVNDPYYAIGTPILTLEAGKAGSLSFTMYPNISTKMMLKSGVLMMNVYRVQIIEIRKHICKRIHNSLSHQHTVFIGKIQTNLHFIYVTTSFISPYW